MFGGGRAYPIVGSTQWCVLGVALGHFLPLGFRGKGFGGPPIVGSRYGVVGIVSGGGFFLSYRWFALGVCFLGVAFGHFLTVSARSQLGFSWDNVH